MIRYRQIIILNKNIIIIIILQFVSAVAVTEHHKYVGCISSSHDIAQVSLVVVEYSYSNEVLFSSLISGINSSAGVTLIVLIVVLVLH